MPFDYAIDRENRLLTITGSGHASMDDRYDLVQRVMNDQSIDGSYQVLIDVCGVSNSPSAGDIGSVASLIERLQSKFRGRVAILNTGVGHVTVTNLIALVADYGDDNVRAFLSGNEAREWLLASVSLARAQT